MIWTELHALPCVMPYWPEREHWGLSAFPGSLPRTVPLVLIGLSLNAVHLSICLF